MNKVTLTTKEAATYLGMSEDYLKRARIKGNGPKFVQIGRKILYLIVELDSFLRDHTRTNLCKK